MLTIKKKDFIRFFLLEYIIIQKESAFDLGYNEFIDLPNNYLEIIESVIVDRINKQKYSDIIDIENMDQWKKNISSCLNNFICSTNGVKYEEKGLTKRIYFNKEAICDILYDKNFNLNTKVHFSHFAEDFLIVQQKEKAKQKEKV